MEYFHSNGGNNKPYFTHRIKIFGELPKGAHEWCLEYDDGGQPFRRFHCEWDHHPKGSDGHKGYVIIQFEWEQAAIMFKLRWL